jgi:DNA-binding beta-propeller fold protein YncE
MSLTNSTPVLSAFSSIYGVGVDGSGKVYVSDVGDGVNNVTVYTIGTWGTTVATIPIGLKPSGFAYDSSLGYMYVTRYSGGTAGVWKISTTSPYTPYCFCNLFIV